MQEQLIQRDNMPKKKFSFYEGFNGRYHKVGEIKDLISQFKAFYYAEKRKDPTRSAIKIINDFNKQIKPLTFFPWEKQYRLWRKKWDADLLAEQGYKQQEREIRHLVKLRDEESAFIVPNEDTLEVGAKTLAGELLNDAFNILKTDQETDAGYTSDEEIRRRNYVLNVYNYVTKAVYGKEALRIKSNKDKRETVDFLMVILRQATAGKITEEELNLLKQSVKNNHD